MQFTIKGGVERFAERVTRWSGSTAGFASAAAIVIVWACLGPIFRYSDTWQLVINTGTTIVTFLMVFLIQRAQNKDAALAASTTGAAQPKRASRAKAKSPSP